MANPIAEAFVRLRPDASVLGRETKDAVRGALGTGVVPDSTSKALGQSMFGRTFREQATIGVASGLAQTTVSGATQRTLAQKMFGPGFRDESGRAIQGALSGVGQGQLAARFAFFGPAGAAIAVLGGALLTASVSAARFERSLSVLQEVTGATDDELKQLTDEALRLGASMELPGVTAQSAADAMTELAKAGLSVKDTLGGVAGVLQLATAANIEAGAAARIVAGALNSFSLEGTEAVRVADLLAGAAIAAQGDIGDMALAMSQAAAAADQAGLKVDELVGFVTLLAKQGILGSDAGTSIRTGLLRLVPTTKEAAGFMEALGIQLDRTRTLGQQLPELLDQYQIALSSLNPTLRQSTLQQISGTDAYRSLSIAIEAGGDGFRQATLEADRQNAALDLARAQTRGLTGETQGLVSSLQTLGTEMGTDINPVLEEVVGSFRGFVDAINDADNALEDFDAASADFLKPLTDRIGEFEEAFGKIAAGALRSDAFGKALFGDVGGGRKAFLADLKDSGLFLAASLEQAIAFRASLLELELPTDKIDKQIDTLRTELRDLRAEGGTDIGIDLASPLEKALEIAEKLKKALQAEGKPIGDVQAEIDLLTNSLERGIVVARERAAKDAAAQNQLARALGFSAEEVAQLIGTVEADGRAAGIALGRTFIDGMSGEITRQEGRAIAAAQDTLESVRRAGETQVLESIRSARGNLESLGSSISSGLEEIIDVGPIGQAIDEIDRKLVELQDKVSRRQLRFDFSQAKTDLRDAQDSIVHVGEVTPAMRRAQKEFLEPFQQKVKDAKSAVQEFDLEETRVELEKTREKAVFAAEQGIQRLIDKFQDGQVSVGEFQTLLSRQLNPQLDILKSKAGVNLGLTIKRDFLRDVEALRGQAEALAGFLGRSGTTPGAQVIRPAATQAGVNAQIAAALSALHQVQTDALVVEKDERDKFDIQIGLLKRLVALAGGTPKKGGGTRDPRVSGRDD